MYVVLMRVGRYCSWDQQSFDACPCKELISYALATCSKFGGTDICHLFGSVGRWRHFAPMVWTVESWHRVECLVNG